MSILILAFSRLLWSHAFRYLILPVETSPTFPTFFSRNFLQHIRLLQAKVSHIEDRRKKEYVEAKVGDLRRCLRFFCFHYFILLSKPVTDTYFLVSCRVFWPLAESGWCWRQEQSQGFAPSQADEAARKANDADSGSD